MWHTNFDLFLVPVMMWLAGLSVLVVSYLATLAIQERRQQQELEQLHQNLGY